MKETNNEYKKDIINLEEEPLKKNETSNLPANDRSCEQCGQIFKTVSFIFIDSCYSIFTACSIR